jgi:hypothetical protein
MLIVSSLPNDSGKGRRDLFKRATDGRLMDQGYGYESERYRTVSDGAATPLGGAWARNDLGEFAV